MHNRWRSWLISRPGTLFLYANLRDHFQFITLEALSGAHKNQPVRPITRFDTMRQTNLFCSAGFYEGSISPNDGRL